MQVILVTFSLVVLVGVTERFLYVVG